MAKPSPKAKDLKVAFWNKQDVQSGVEAIKRQKEGRPTNKSTDEFIEELKKRGEW